MRKFDNLDLIVQDVPAAAAFFRDLVAFTPAWPSTAVTGSDKK